MLTAAIPVVAILYVIHSKTTATAWVYDLLWDLLITACSTADGYWFELPFNSHRLTVLTKISSLSCYHRRCFSRRDTSWLANENLLVNWLYALSYKLHINHESVLSVQYNKCPHFTCTFRCETANNDYN